MAPKTRNQRLNGLHPLSYVGVNPTTPTNFVVDNRAPTINDYAEFDLGDIWLDESSLPATPPVANDIYMLVDKSAGIATWVNFGGGGALMTLTGDTGGAVPADASDNINLLGTATHITTTGNPGTNTITFNTGSAVATSYLTDSGSAVPAAGVLTVHGAHGLNTSGAASTVTVAINNAITLGDLSNIAANSNALTIATGDIQFTATNNVGNLKFPNTHSSGNAGVIRFNGIRYFHNYNAGRPAANLFVGGNAGNFTLDAIGDSRNVGVGDDVLSSLTTGALNCAHGSAALNLCTSGSQNNAFGASALTALTTGMRNNSFGLQSAEAITSGGYNCAFGQIALAELTTGSRNIAIGSGDDSMSDKRTALGNLATGSFNIAIGSGVTTTTGGAGANYTGAESSNISIGPLAIGTLGESNVIRIGDSGAGNGQQNKCFIAGIRGVTTDAADAIAVLISSTGQLGTVSSSLRYKENVKDMVDNSSPLFQLRPVTFFYKAHEKKTTQFGLIAEEVEKVMPELVVRDQEGLPSAVKYHDLPILLLNEIQKLYRRVQELEQRLDGTEHYD